MGSTFFSKRIRIDNGRLRKSRQKSFKTKESADKYAKAAGLTKYKVVPLTYSKKLVIVKE